MSASKRVEEILSRAREEYTAAFREFAPQETVAQWKEVARRAGICMTCALGAPDTFGCSDCRNTGWIHGAPDGFVPDLEYHSRDSVGPKEAAARYAVKLEQILQASCIRRS